MMKVLEGFHHRAARRITGNQARRLPNGDWEYPPLAPALEAAGLWPMKEYVRRRQAHIAEYVATRPIFQLCSQAPALSGSSRALRWWQQDHSASDDDAAVAGGAHDDGDGEDNG